ncbi:S41 family peptidase [Candidatus Kapabacteria bacterium]|nr:S41 family peptidase [Candidatus Kapabacteria bacterium]
MNRLEIMMKIIKIITAIFLLGLLTSSQNEDLFKLNKTFDIYGAVVRDINEYYVEDVNPELLLKNSLTGMLKELDPYTEYYEEQDKEKIEIITNGNYVGFGINIKKIDNQIVVSGFANDFIAFNDGLRIGDILYKVDSTVVLNLNSSELKKYSQGTPGSIADVKVIRKSDTLSLLLKRHKVEMENIAYYGRTQKGMGYIKLSRFTRGAADELESAVLDLQKRNIKGIIIDLRDNPGGLLDEAVRICELFVPKNTMIVSTKSKNINKSFNYQSRSEPINSTIPIAVLINKGSASASEIVAGCLQDNDRGVIIGRNSFGKGLVQTIIKLPYNSSMKITTARYYTPSGRSIQRKDYYNKIKSDTATFYTVGGRPMFERRGISPDSIIAKKKFTDFVTKIYNDDLIFKFGNRISYEFDKTGFVPNHNFEISDSLLNVFKEFISDSDYIYKTKSNKLIEDLYIQAIDLKLDSTVDALLDDLDRKFKLDKGVLVDNNKNEIVDLIRYEILRRFHNLTDLTRIFTTQDSVVKSAETILSDKTYSRILSGKLINNKSH